MHYLLRTFLRQASTAQVVEYLAARGITVEIPKKKRNAKTAGWMFEDLRQRLGDEHIDFAAIQTLAHEAGAQLLLHDAGAAGLDIVAPFAAQDSFLAKSFWMFLNHRAVFDSALRVSATDHLPGRYWKRRLPVPGSPSTAFEQRREILEHEIATYFSKEEARGHLCRVEYDDRAPKHRFVAYPEDFPARPFVWTGTGLEPQSIRPAFELVFIYDATAQSLDVYAKGGKKVAEAMWRVFAHAVFGLHDLPVVPRRNFGLERLKDRDFVFRRPIDGPIKEVRISRLRLAMSGAETVTVSVEVERDQAGALHRALDRFFPATDARQGFDLAAAKVIGATIAATFDERNGRGSRVRSFDISPRSCALKYDGIDGLLRQMLRDSGIDPTS